MKRLVLLLLTATGMMVGCSSSDAPYPAMSTGNHYIYSKVDGSECGHYKYENGTWMVYEPSDLYAEENSFDTEVHAQLYIIKEMCR